MPERVDPTDVEQSLRETSDKLLAALDELAALEQRKRTLTPGDDAIVDLSTRIEEIAEQVLGASAAQRELTEVGERLVSAGDPAAPTLPIDDVPRSASVILDDWRQTERLMAEAAPGSPEHARLQREADILRKEYLAAFRRASGRLD